MVKKISANGIRARIAFRKTKERRPSPKEVNALDVQFGKLQKSPSEAVRAALRKDPVLGGIAREYFQISLDDVLDAFDRGDEVRADDCAVSSYLRAD